MSAAAMAAVAPSVGCAILLSAATWPTLLSSRIMANANECRRQLLFERPHRWRQQLKVVVQGGVCCSFRSGQWIGWPGCCGQARQCRQRHAAAGCKFSPINVLLLVVVVGSADTTARARATCGKLWLVDCARTDTGDAAAEAHGCASAGLPAYV